MNTPTSKMKSLGGAFSLITALTGLVLGVIAIRGMPHIAGDGTGFNTPFWHSVFYGSLLFLLAGFLLGIVFRRQVSGMAAIGVSVFHVVLFVLDIPNHIPQF